MLPNGAQKSPHLNLVLHRILRDPSTSWAQLPPEARGPSLSYYQSAGGRGSPRVALVRTSSVLGWQSNLPSEEGCRHRPKKGKLFKVRPCASAEKRTEPRRSPKPREPAKKTQMIRIGFK